MTSDCYARDYTPLLLDNPHDVLASSASRSTLAALLRLARTISPHLAGIGAKLFLVSALPSLHREPSFALAASSQRLVASDGLG
jgi:hypothetical protein